MDKLSVMSDLDNIFVSLGDLYAIFATLLARSDTTKEGTDALMDKLKSIQLVAQVDISFHLSLLSITQGIKNI